jgi:hypothetical protein
MKLTLVFTPIVHGPHDGAPDDNILRCTVHVGLRLDPENDPAHLVLSAWPDIIGWPQLPISASLVFPDGTSGPVLQVPIGDAALWQAFFPSGTAVEAYPDPAAAPALDGDTLWYDASAVADFTKARVAAAGRSVFTATSHAADSSFTSPLMIGSGLGSSIVAADLLVASSTLLGQIKPFFAPKPVSAETSPPPVHLHARLAALHGVPGALASLRLAFELQAPLPAGAARPPAVRVNAVVTASTLTPTIVSPWVALATTTAADAFVPPSEWMAVEFDVSGAAHALAQQSGEPAALKTAGYALVRRPQDSGSALLAAVRARAARAAQLGQSPQQALAYDDLVRGLRVDVRDETRGRWLSLCRITGAASSGGKSIAFDGEGMITPAVTRDMDGVLRANDTIARWLGWSLCAASPAAAAADQPSPDLALTTQVAPGTLAALRFGRSYRFRLRKVDVTGGGPSLSQTADLTGASDAIPFLRLEPVTPPTILLGSVPGPGESPMQLVVCSGPSVGAPATTIRYLLPPDAGPELVTMHGMFDTANGVPDPAARARLRDGNLWAGTPPATAFPAKADVFAATKFDAPPAITYLPDPLAVGATIRALSGGDALGLTADAPELVVPFVTQAAAYPDGFAAATVKLSAASGAGSATITGSVLDLKLPPGKTATFAVSCGVAPQRLAHLAVHSWSGGGLVAPHTETFTDALSTGAVPAVSPMQVVSVLHAVQQPLAPPELDVQLPARQPGETALRLQGTVDIDPATTASVAFTMTWPDYVDGGPGAPAPGPVTRSAQLGLLLVRPGQAQLPFAFSYQMHTTAALTVSLRPVAAGAFAEHFPPGTDCSLAGDDPVEINVPSTAAPLAPKVLYAIPTFARSEQRPTPLSVIRKRDGNGLRIWLERPWFTSGLGEKLAVVVSPTPGSTSASVSRWGLDAAILNAEPTAPAGPFGTSDFLAAAAPRVRWPGDATRPAAATLVLHDVTYDPISDRYWCDILLNPASLANAYRPFVQLAVAAYQPKATTAALQLSEIVVVPFVQVFSDRELHVSLTAGSPPTIAVSLVGPRPNDPAEGILIENDGLAASRRLYTQPTLDMSFDGHAVVFVIEDNPDGEPPGHHPHPPLPPELEHPEFERDRTFTASDYSITETRLGRIGPDIDWPHAWRVFSVTVQEFEMAGVYTLDMPFQAAPNNLVTLASDFFPKQMRRAYRETITINSPAP